MNRAKPRVENNEYYLDALLLLHQAQAVEKASYQTQDLVGRIAERAESEVDQPRQRKGKRTNTRGDDLKPDLPVVLQMKKQQPLADDLTEDGHHSEDDTSSNPLRGQYEFSTTDVPATMIAEMQKEIDTLKESVRTAYEALVSVNKNADLRISKLQLEVVHLERKLADEQAITSGLVVVNESLRRQVKGAYANATEEQDESRMKRIERLHKKELVVEGHLNSLLVARSQAVKQNATLKRLLLQTCPECRARLPLKKKNGSAIPPQKPPLDRESRRVGYESASMYTLDASTSSLGISHVMKSTVSLGDMMVEPTIKEDDSQQSQAELDEPPPQTPPPPPPRATWKKAQEKVVERVMMEEQVERPSPPKPSAANSRRRASEHSPTKSLEQSPSKSLQDRQTSVTEQPMNGHQVERPKTTASSAKSPSRRRLPDKHTMVESPTRSQQDRRTSITEAPVAKAKSIPGEEKSRIPNKPNEPDQRDRKRRWSKFLHQNRVNI